MLLMNLAWTVREETARKRMKKPCFRERFPHLPPLLECAPRLEPWATCVDGAGQSELVYYAACRLAGLSAHDAETSVSIHPVSANLVEDALKQVAWSPGREQTPPRLSADALDVAQQLMEALVRRLDPMLVQDALRTMKVAVGGLELTTDRPASGTARAIVEAINTSQLVPRAVFTRARGGTLKHRTGAAEIVRALSDPALKHDRVLLYATYSGRRNATQALLLSGAFVAAMSGFITPSIEVA